ncbi:MAG: NAD(P)H-dependent oxidoreductase [Candidatus Omnitrophica bacterium]|nr:NAD(P)H-dependent oxidoreductase [Candidatus Omnitrophota bacterium]
MVEPPRILAFAGSAREGSFNKKLVRVAADSAGRAGAEVTVIDLKDYPLPLFDQDFEKQHGLPEPAKALKVLFREHHALLIASPEYNSSVTPLMKNTLDWISRVESADEPPLSAFKGKLALLLSASPGALGGLRGLVHLRAILQNIGVIVLPGQRAVPAAHEAFDDNGQIKNEKLRQAVEFLGEELTRITQRML